ncbi:ribosome biogenesis GTP-binding protein YihA/YsxC [Xylocopilactobacillus apis]|uniref:Probable GTP-binding protein EngB n=1 Tax=Xylocopilactobacillus apis TaxID=2932183 RepID=A0AAU9D8R7_9LACO|nr:ribosome biogenesis GTP-binding protein YihA/YsxC [Xylocopilactobacillus apis]BDR57182.1 putative GTP-binding protein EngB [Xylocopilactobacillus apis]
MANKDQQFVTSAVKAVDFPKSNLPRIAFFGRSNVGKSSLINTLMNRKNLARTSSTPGKTQTVNFYLATDNSYQLVDYPGYGYAKLGKKKRAEINQMIRTTVSEIDNLRGIVQLVDGRIPTQPVDLEFEKFLNQVGVPQMIAVTKTDKVKKSEIGKLENRIEKDFGENVEMVEYLLTSTVSKRGITDLKTWISELTNF